jgi:hypothetical protein
MSEFASPKLASANDKRGLPHHVGFYSLSANAGNDLNWLLFWEIRRQSPLWT